MLYQLLQSVITLPGEFDIEVKKLLNEIHEQLFELIKSEMLPHDCSVICSTTLALLIPYVCSGSPKIHFINILNESSDTQNENDKKFIKYDDKETYFCKCSKSCDEYLNHQLLMLNQIEPSYSTLLLIHGLVNSNCKWVFTSDFDCKLSSDKIMCESDKFLIHLYPILRKLCLSLSSYVFQAMSSLHLWCRCIRTLNNSYFQLKGANVIENSSCTATSADIEFLEGKILFGIPSNDEKCLFSLLNSSWESPIKGIKTTGNIYI